MCVQSNPMRPMGRRVRSGAFGPFSCGLGIVVFIRVHSVHYRAPKGSSDLFVCVRFIAVRRGGRGLCSCAFAPFSCTLGVVRVRFVHSRAPWDSFGCVRSIPVRPGDHTVHSRSPLVSSGSCRCVWSIPMLPRGPRVRLGAFSRFPCALVFAVWNRCVRSIHMSYVLRRVRSSAFGPFPCALGIVVLVRERSVHSRAAWGSFGCIRPIPMRPGDRRVR